MTIKLRFVPGLFVFGFAYMPGVGFGIHVPGFALTFTSFDEDDDDGGGELMPIKDAA